MPPSPVRSPLEAVHRLSRAVRHARTPADVTGALVVGLRDGLELGQVHLSEVSQGGDVGHALVTTGEGPGPVRYVQVLDERPSGVARVVATGEPLIVTDARGSGDVRQDLVERFDVASLAYVPLHWGGEVRYVAILISHERREFDAEAIAFAETLANPHRDPDRVPDHPRLRRLQRDDHDTPLSRGDVAARRGRRTARQVRHAVRPAGRRGAAQAPARGVAQRFGGRGEVISVAV